jgi:hypothetical protein
MFVNAQKDFNNFSSGPLDAHTNPEIDSIINNNSEYSQRNYNTSSHYGNSQKRYNNNYRNNNSNYGNNYQQRNTHNNNYKKQ